MKRLLALILTASALLLALMSCGRITHTLNIIGDCEGFRVTAVTGKSVSLEEAVASSGPRAKEFDLLLIGTDGLVARISGNDLSGCILVYSKEYAWELRSEGHPPSANIKNLANIVVTSTSEDIHATRFINAEKTQSLTAGQLLLRASRVLNEEGTSSLDGRNVTVYTTQWRISFAEMLPKGKSFCAVGIDGKALYFSDTKDCFLVFDKTQISLILPDGREIKGLAGVMANPPRLTITQTTADALRFLEQGERVMIILLDGWGYSMQRRAGNKWAPFLHSLEPERALACYPPISPVGLASMLTGKTPDVHGITDRENREMLSEDLFTAAAKMSTSSAYIEGSRTLINTSLAPVLSLSDAEVFKNAMKALENKPDLIFVHFHEIDDAGHQYGPYAAQTLQKIWETDSYVRELAKAFDSRLIITADHGMRELLDGGAHGQFFSEDMLVPYAVR